MQKASGFRRSRIGLSKQNRRQGTEAVALT